MPSMSRFLLTNHHAWSRNAWTHARCSTHLVHSRLASTTASNGQLPLSQVVKIHCTQSPPDRAQQWQNKSQRHSTGSGFIISEQRILTNAHVVANHNFVTVTKHNSGTHYPAEVVSVGHECDMAMLQVRDDSFFESIDGNECFEFGEIPELQDTVTVLGYPTGGDAISVTRGVVSRVEVVSYIHAAHYLLAIQIDAAINSGNSGGPAIMDGKVIGIAFQNMPDAENVGYIIPTPIIQHFLGDIARFGEYRGFCSLGIAYQSLLDTKSIHRFFGLPSHETGILVRKVYDYSVAKGVIRAHDIITHIDEHKIQNDGTTTFRNNETIAMEHVLAQKFDQEHTNITVWRDGACVTLERIEMSVFSDKKRKTSSHLVPIHQYDEQSSYYVFGGCVFTTLTQPFLHTWGDDWFHTAPRELILEAVTGNLPCNDDDAEGHGVQQLVLMSSVRPHDSNMGCSRFCNIVLEKVGDIKIKSLAHLKEVIEKEFVRNYRRKALIDFHFKKDALMVLDIEASIGAEPEIMHRNRIPHRQSQDLDEYDDAEIVQLMNGMHSDREESNDANVAILREMQEVDDLDDSITHDDVHADDNSKLV